MSCFLKHGSCSFFQFFHVAFSCWTVDHTCLAETASTDTSSLNLQSDTVLCCFDMRNDRSLQIVIILIHVNDQLLFYFFRNTFACRMERFDRTVFFIGNFIKRRYIDSRNLCGFQKKIRSAATGFFVCFIYIKKCVINSFTFTNIKEVKEFCQRFRIVCTGTTTDYDWIIFFAVS